MVDEDDDDMAFSYWPSVSDLFMTLFTVALAIVASVIYLLIPHDPSNSKTVINGAGMEVDAIYKPVNKLRRELAMAELVGSQSADKAAKALKETTDEAVTQITDLRRKLADLANTLAKIKPNEGDDIAGLQGRITSLKGELDDMKGKYNRMLKLNEERMVHIDEATKEYRFQSRSAFIDDKFREGLYQKEFRKLADDIINRNEKRETAVNTLEIIGYTDGKAVGGTGNLDEKLPDLLASRNVAEQDKLFKTLEPGSNNDLGLLRALAVRDAWLAFVASQPNGSLLRGIDVRCYSAGQTIPQDDGAPKDIPDTYRKDDRKSRRIEMRVTRLNK